MCPGTTVLGVLRARGRRSWVFKSLWGPGRLVITRLNHVFLDFLLPKLSFSLKNMIFGTKVVESGAKWGGEGGGQGELTGGSSKSIKNA